MSQTAIPLQFEKYLQNQISVGKAPDMNEMIFAYIPNLDPSQPIDRNQGLPAVSTWVHQQDIDQVGKLGDNALVYSVVIPGSVAAFTFNAIYLRDKNVPNSCGMVVHKATETKEDGMASTKSLMQQYTGAAQIAGITVDAQTWQIDYQARLLGIEDDMRLANLDNYGHTAFIQGFDVTQQADPAKYKVAPGVVYVGGLRAELKNEVIQTISAKPTGLYIDVVRTGTVLSKWQNIVTVRASAAPLTDYVDQNQQQHYVARLAGINANGSVEDWREKGGLPEHEAAENPHPQYALASLVRSLSANAFHKSQTSEPAFLIAGGQLRTATALTIRVGDSLITHAANEVISTPTLLVGVDYAIYTTPDGLVVSNNFTVPDGYTAENSRRIGGFHYGNNEFKDYSFYDLHFRPKCKDPRGMVIDISGSRFWNDIYLLNSTPDALGTSAYNAQIADGSSPCKIPALWGGDGTAQYPNLTQYIAAEVLAAYGKRLPSHDEFEILALGSTPGYSVGTDPVKTKFDVSARSKNGSEQVSGHLWQWGKDVWDRGNGINNYAWAAEDTNGQGQVYSAGVQAVGAVLLGANWGNSGFAGARASSWGNEPWGSGDSVGARGLCDHLLHV
ncbi:MULTISPECIES: phage tail protein [Vibrio]|uniref:phage major tropism determinant n=1 Tax=Vibrio TaxID=662 RepID=UPI00021AA5E6|nr:MULTISPECIES: phage tail protein [Vibrio]EGS66981.1 phage tail domain protein [Vibrio paracholerae HE-09]